ncbi:MAG: AAA family ATPase [Hyphomicrobium sp.]|uniref:AAA family ATPase n=1 Tax=Hyphomicrobium sp. TaxID=82 RepID=UPI003D11CAB0
MQVTRERIAEELAETGYIADSELATSLHIMRLIGRPLLIEGAAGVGKTEVAKALAATLGTRLIRLQCYEGLDQSSALYEWNYQRQLIAIQVSKESTGEKGRIEEAELFSERYLLERPLLAAIRQPQAPVLLIDEIDRADEEFEAFLLELLSDFQITIPELGTITATSVPQVILTSNGTRDLSDALRRRCLYHYLDFPDVERETRIILARLPGISVALAGQIARVVEQIRKQELRKTPGVAETLDWAAVLLGLNLASIEGNHEAVHETLLCLLKTNEDRKRISPEVSARILGKAA